MMEYNYTKKSIWKWVLLYLAIGALVYTGIYFFFYRNGGYLYTSQNYQNADWKTYKNSEYGFEITYPTDLHFAAGAVLLKCPANYCIGISHLRGPQDNRVFIFSMDISNKDLYSNRNTSFFNIKDYQEVSLGGYKALYRESKQDLELDTGVLIHEVDKDYIIVKDGKTYQITVNIDGDNKGDTTKLDTMLSSFKFTK